MTGNRSGYSLVLTAGHCAYDETNATFAANWMFRPKFGSKTQKVYNTALNATANKTVD